MKISLISALFCLLFTRLTAQNQIGPSGNIGISTTNPLAPLQINKLPGSTMINEGLRIVNLFNSSANNNPGIILTNDLSTDPMTSTAQSWSLSSFVAGSASFSISYKGGNSPLITPFFVNGEGKIGLGTATPSGLLSLGGNISNRKLLVYDGTTEAAGFGQGASEFRMFAPVSGNNHISLGRYDFGSDVFSEQMRVDYNGNVGIGTDAPAAKLDINGGIYAESGESHFSVGTYADPLSGVPFGIKVGSNGIAVNGNSVFNNGLSIGTSNLNGYLLAVKGNIHAQQVVVELNNFPDYVFKHGYRLIPLKALGNYVSRNHHLPGLPAAAVVEMEGLDLGEMNKMLAKKVEELTLYLIQKDKQLSAQQTMLNKLDRRLKKIEKKK